MPAAWSGRIWLARDTGRVGGPAAYSLGSAGFGDRDQSPRLGLFLTFEATELIHPIGETDT